MYRIFHLPAIGGEFAVYATSCNSITRMQQCAAVEQKSKYQTNRAPKTPTYYFSDSSENLTNFRPNNFYTGRPTQNPAQTRNQINVAT